MSEKNEIIGSIGNTRLPYYNVRTRKNEVKARPVLVIGAEKRNLPCDLTCLPISKVSLEKNRDELFDHELDDEMVNNLNLRHKPSYIRTHKVFTASSQDFAYFKNGSVNIQKDYPGLFKEVKEKFNEFTERLF